MLRGSTSTQNGVDATPKELEVVAAELETRLNETLLRLVSPCWEQATGNKFRFESLLETVERQGSRIVRMENEQEKDRVQVFKMQEEAAARDKAIQEFEESVHESLGKLRDGSAEAGKRIHELHKKVSKHGIDIERVCSDCLGVEGRHKALAQRLDAATSNIHRQLDQAREHALSLHSEVTLRCDRHDADLYGSGKLISHLGEDIGALQKLTASMHPLEESVAALCRRSDACEQHVEACVTTCSVLRTEVDICSTSTGQALGEVAGKVEQEITRLMAHHEDKMKEFRRSLEEELANVRETRDTLSRGQDVTNAQCMELGASVSSETRRIDALHEELMKDLGRCDATAVRDRSHFDECIVTLKEEVAQHTRTAEVLNRTVEFLGHIIGLVLEGDKALSALAIQDYADRSAERWLCLPGEAGRQPQPPYAAEGSAPELRASLRPAPAANDALVVVDPRKGLATGQYLPGHVSYGGTQFDRRDMLAMHSTFLEKAQAALRKGPSERTSAPAGGTPHVTIAGRAEDPAASSSSWRSKASTVGGKDIALAGSRLGCTVSRLGRTTSRAVSSPRPLPQRFCSSTEWASVPQPASSVLLPAHQPARRTQLPAPEPARTSRLPPISGPESIAASDGFEPHAILSAVNSLSELSAADSVASTRAPGGSVARRKCMTAR